LYCLSSFIATTVPKEEEIHPIVLWTVRFFQIAYLIVTYPIATCPTVIAVLIAQFKKGNEENERNPHDHSLSPTPQ
jgi:hypothetical protein